MQHKKPLSVLMSGVLAMALSPAVAFAAPSLLEAADAGLQPQATATEQAQTTIYLPMKVAAKTVRSDGTSTIESQTSFKYKNGLLASRTEKNSGGKTTYKWLYKGSNVRAVKAGTAKLVFRLNGKGRKTSGTWTMRGSSSDKIVETYKYTGSRIKTCKSVTYWTDMMTGKKDHNTTKTTYAYKGKYPTKAKINSAGFKSKTTYSYDSHNNLAKIANGSLTKYVNTYENDLLKTRTEVANHEGDDVVSYTYTYKPVKVKNSLAAKAKAQRWAILNQNLNYELGGIVMN